MDYEEIYQKALTIARENDSLEDAEAYMLSKGLGCFGIEGVSCAGRSMEYINMGGTYDSTIVCEDGEYELTSWGDWYESAEQAYCEEHGAVRCAYCGEFTPLKTKDWHETVCEACGHYADGSK